MAVNKVVYGNKTLIDLSGDTLVSADQLLKDIVAHCKDGSTITGTMEAGGGDIKVDTGSFIIATSHEYATTIEHDLGKIPTLVFVYCDNGAVSDFSGGYDFIWGIAYQDGPFDDTVKMMAQSGVYRSSYVSTLFCCKVNDIVYYNGADIRSATSNDYCAIYNVTSERFSIDTRLNKKRDSQQRPYFCQGKTYKWFALCEV